MSYISGGVESELSLTGSKPGRRQGGSFRRLQQRAAPCLLPCQGCWPPWARSASSRSLPPASPGLLPLDTHPRDCIGATWVVQVDSSHLKTLNFTHLRSPLVHVKFWGLEPLQGAIVFCVPQPAHWPLKRHHPTCKTYWSLLTSKLASKSQSRHGSRPPV